MPKILTMTEKLDRALGALAELSQRQQRLETLLTQNSLTAGDLVSLNPLMRRNIISNDAATQKQLIASWSASSKKQLEHNDLIDSGFRAFSQNDEDGILLRIFSHIGTTNRYAIEIGSNCNYSDIGIPENLTTNLIINHGWHASIFELDEVECSRMQYFFARAHATQHYHWLREDKNTYYSPKIIQQMISPNNINDVLIDANNEPQPDLMIIDIDGGDFLVMEQLRAVRPRVLVVEFEKRFRDRYSVYQPDREDFSKKWQQSGSTSLNAWIKLLKIQGYALCTVGTCCYNAFFVRNDVADGKLKTLSPAYAYESHPVFSTIDNEFWLTPDETWKEV
ncbi:FkbM family methyltransferase [Pseudomonas sp. S2_H01]